MNRSLKVPILVALALCSSQVLAVSLGQIQVKSSLNAPLVAEIPLHEDYPGEADGVQVALASNEDFTRAGLDPTQLKVPLTFAVATNAQGQKVIRVTSSELVREPYLDFLVQVNWPKGKALREFTILLDPPGAMRAAPVPSAPAPTQRTQMAQPQPPSQAAAVSGAISDGRYGPVQTGDTLSKVAREARTDGVSYQQMLLALKTANPDAFFRDNINALKKGAVLRIPTGAEAQALTRAAAIAEVRRQNEDWQGAAARSPTLVASAGGDDGASTTITAAGGSDAGDRLSLVPPGEGGSGGASRAGVTGGTSDTTAAGLRQDLARSKEALSSQQQQAAELQSRVADLEAMSTKNQRLLSLKDAEIAELQRNLADARKAAGLPPAPATAGTTANAVPTPVKAPAATAAPPETLPAVPVAPAMPWYRQTWTMIAGLVVLLGLILIGLLRWRGPRGEPEARPSLSDHFRESPFGAAADGLDDTDMDADQRELLTQLAEHPDDIGLHLELAGLYYTRGDVEHFEAAAEAMYAHVTDPEQPEWLDVCAMGEELAPGHPLFASGAQTGDGDEREALDDFDLDSYASVPADADTRVEDAPVEDAPVAPAPDADAPAAPRSTDYSYEFELTPRATTTPAPPPAAPAMEEFDALPPLPAGQEPAFEPEPIPAPAPTPEPAPAPAASDFDAADRFNDDAVDTKLDLARAYLDMGDPDGARSMLDEVMVEGSQMQKDAARKLLEELGK